MFLYRQTFTPPPPQKDLPTVREDFSPLSIFTAHPEAYLLLDSRFSQVDNQV